MGTPSSEDQKFITNDGALKYIRSLPKRSKQNWKVLFPNTSNEGLDLLERTLTFNPNKRISVADCLRHPYFEDYDELEESDSCEPFDWAADKIELRKEVLQELMYQEAATFRPPPSVKN